MGSPGDVPEPQKVERLRFTQPSPGSISGRKATKLDQSGFLRMQRQCELPQPLTQIRLETPGIPFVLKAGDNIVGEAHVENLPVGMAAPPLISPQVKAVVKVDVSERRRGR
jgi:hypothetical protein